MNADVEGAAAALAGLPCVGPARLRRLLRHHRPAEALAGLCGTAPLHPMATRGIPPRELAVMSSAARRADPTAALSACAAAGARVLVHGVAGYPLVLSADPAAPAVLFVRGDPDLLAARRVAVVGTRNATPSGLATARELGVGLSEAGVAVVSGLARGVDGAVHAGVRSAGGPGRPAAVVGSGVDVAYPRHHADLWEWVAGAGVLMSEWPPGTAPDAWRFPQRNRVIAALCEVLVVVESRERGGSLITARMAIDRGVEVMAVPGSPRSPASAGTNGLLRDGAAPVTAVDDVLMMLGLDHRRHGALPFDPRPLPTGNQASVLRACETRPGTLDQIATSTGLSLVDVALAAARLERSGWLIEAGGWFEPTSSRFDVARRVGS